MVSSNYLKHGCLSILTIMLPVHKKLVSRKIHGIPYLSHGGIISDFGELKTSILGLATNFNMCRGEGGLPP